MTEVVPHEGRRDLRTITGTRNEVMGVLLENRNGIQLLSEPKRVPGTGLYTSTVRLLPESPTQPIGPGSIGRARVARHARVINARPPRRIPRWARWALVAVGLVVLVALSVAVGAWLFTPDAPPPAAPAVHTARTGDNGAMAGLVGLLVVSLGLTALLRLVFGGGGRTFSGTFRGKVD